MLQILNEHINQEYKTYSVTPKISLTSKELSLEQNSDKYNQNNMRKSNKLTLIIITEMLNLAT